MRKSVSMDDARTVVIVSPGLLEIPSARGGGIEEIDYQIARRLSNSFKVVILAPFLGGYTRRMKLKESLTIEHIPFPALRVYPPASRRQLYFQTIVLAPIGSIATALDFLLIVVQARSRIAIVHNGLQGLTAAFIARILGLAVIYSEGNTTPWTSPYVEPYNLRLSERIMSAIHLAIGKTIAMLSECIRVQSNSIREGMTHESVRSSKITVIPGGVDTSILMPQLGMHSEGKGIRIGFIGRLTEEKGAHLLAQVINLATNELPLARFVILGEGPYAKSISKMPNVEFIGWVPRNELTQFLLRMDFVVFFQRELGLAELEAMAAGKIIIGCDAGEMRSYITDLHNGVLCPPIPLAYIRAMRQLLENPKLSDTISKNARDTAVRQFSWEAVGEKWVQICEVCLGNR